jgi:hypothetical protein
VCMIALIVVTAMVMLSCDAADEPGTLYHVLYLLRMIFLLIYGQSHGIYSLYWQSISNYVCN